MRSLVIAVITVVVTFVSVYPSGAGAKADSRTEAQIQQEANERLRLDVNYWLEPGSRLSTRTSEKAAQKLEAGALSPLYVVFKDELSRKQIALAKEAFNDLVSFVPVTDGSFEAVVANNPKKALELTTTIRDYVQHSIYEATQNPETRLVAWEFINQRLENHMTLASGANGKLFLQTFSIWALPLVTTASTEADRQQRLRYEGLYRRAFNAMKTAKPFLTTHEMWRPSDFAAKSDAAAKFRAAAICEGLFKPARQRPF